MNEEIVPTPETTAVQAAPVLIVLSRICRSCFGALKFSLEELKKGLTLSTKIMVVPAPIDLTIGVEGKILDSNLILDLLTSAPLII